MEPLSGGSSSERDGCYPLDFTANVVAWVAAVTLNQELCMTEVHGMTSVYVGNWWKRPLVANIAMLVLIS